MSDFPNGGDLKATRTWLDRKGFEGLFIGWEAEALLGQDRADLLFLAGGENEKSLKESETVGLSKLRSTIPNAEYVHCLGLIPSRRSTDCFLHFLKLSQPPQSVVSKVSSSIASINSTQ